MVVCRETKEKKRDWSGGLVGVGLTRTLTPACRREGAGWTLKSYFDSLKTARSNGQPSFLLGSEYSQSITSIFCPIFHTEYTGKHVLCYDQSYINSSKHV
jgi:hypothetical protein